MKDYSQNTFQDIIESEKQMVLDASARYGIYFEHALKFNLLLQNFDIRCDVSRYIFMSILGFVRKHHTLALFSTLRLHSVQSMMLLRQVLEASAMGAYAIANPDKDNFAQINPNGTLKTYKLEKFYGWLDKNYKAGSDSIKAMKDLINNDYSHANIILASINFKLKKEGTADTPYFDFEDEYHIKTYLWQNANIAMGIIDLFYGVNLDYKAITFADDFLKKFKELEKTNNILKHEMMQTERYKNAEQLSSV